MRGTWPSPLLEAPKFRASQNLLLTPRPDVLARAFPLPVLGKTVRTTTTYACGAAYLRPAYGYPYVCLSRPAHSVRKSPGPLQGDRQLDAGLGLYTGLPSIARRRVRVEANAGIRDQDGAQRLAQLGRVQICSGRRVDADSSLRVFCFMGSRPRPGPPVRGPGPRHASRLK